MEYLPKPKAQQLTQLAETARSNLSKLSGVEVEFNAEGLSMLDEWIDRHMQQYQESSPELRTIWGAFFGETFRRKFNGEWGLHREQMAPLGIICSSHGSRVCFVDVQAQMQRRIQNGMQDSLVYYYTMKGIEVSM